MYIGPWQEFKLARLIQQQQQAQQLPPLPPRHGRLPARRPSSAVADDAASVASSSRSGLSTQSAPARLPQASAQSRLNDYYDASERSQRPPQQRRGSSAEAAPGGPRPRSSGLGTRSSSSLGAGARRGGGAAAKKPAKNKEKPVSFEEQRRARILQMQKLYGLAREEDASGGGGGDGQEADTAASAARLPLVSQSSGYAAAAPAVETGPAPDMDNALRQLCASMDACDAQGGRGGENAPPPPPLDSTFIGRSGFHSKSASPLPPLPEDPVSMSNTLGSSGGLIAWSKNLQAEELSPQATLASFFSPNF